MKNKFGGAAVIGAIAFGIYAVLEFILGLILNLILKSVRETSTRMAVYAILNMIVFSLAMFIGIKIYCKILKKEYIISRSLILSAIAGVLSALIVWLLSARYSILSYVICFAELFQIARIVTGTKWVIPEGIGEASFQAQGQKRPVANEAMSAQAQYAYHELLAAAQNSATKIDTVMEAKLFAQAVEMQALKSPATAKFCSPEEMVVTMDNGKYIISGYVDSQNSYGAIVRTPFRVTVFQDYGVWKSADTFISSSVTVASHMLLYWIIGTILTVASIVVIFLIIT